MSSPHICEGYPQAKQKGENNLAPLPYYLGTNKTIFTLAKEKLPVKGATVTTFTISIPLLFLESSETSPRESLQIVEPVQDNSQ